MELETGKFSLPRDSLGPNSVFDLCESLMFSHKILDKCGSKKILNPLLPFALVTSERRAKPFRSACRQEQNSSPRKPASTGGMS